MTRRGRTRLVALATAAIVVAASVNQGAYFSRSWGWVALAFLVPTAIVLMLGTSPAPGRLRAALPILVGALGLWIALSASWSLSSSASIRETERMLVYVAIALAVAFVLRRGDAGGVAGGVFGGITVVSAYALATRLFPDRFEYYGDSEFSYRLSEPIGYWNSLGLLVAMGAILGIGVVAHGRFPAHRIVAGLALPILAVTLYFTFSRGSWVALALGLFVTIALDPRRLELVLCGVVVAPPSAIAVWVASGQDALTTEGALLADAVEQGERLSLGLVVLVLVSGALAATAGLATSRVSLPRPVVHAANLALAAVLVATPITVVAAVGGPGRALEEVRDRFDGPLTVRDPSDLNDRLFSLSGSGRTEHLRVAWDVAQERPLLGHGAGTYEYHWYLRRESLGDVRDAHSLYVEMLAEVGVVGLGLLSLALVTLLVGSVRGRRARHVAATTGAFVAWAAHSGLDWNWEIVGVTSAAVLAGATGLLAGERGALRPVRAEVRWPVAGAVVTLSVLAVVSLVGNQALFAGREAVAREEFAEAGEHARHARDLLPWSHEPSFVLGDVAAGLGDREGALRAFRDAVQTDPVNWVAWLRLAQVATGDERRRAYARVRELNPLEVELPGEGRGG